MFRGTGSKCSPRFYPTDAVLRESYKLIILQSTVNMQTI